jgi:hypothetical protein
VSQEPGVRSGAGSSLRVAPGSTLVGVPLVTSVRDAATRLAAGDGLGLMRVP